jgi:hypothetical protein
VVAAIVVAKVGTDYVNTRNRLPTWPALMLVVALGIGPWRAITPITPAALAGFTLESVIRVCIRPRRWHCCSIRGCDDDSPDP